MLVAAAAAAPVGSVRGGGSRTRVAGVAGPSPRQSFPGTTHQAAPVGPRVLALSVGGGGIPGNVPDRAPTPLDRPGTLRASSWGQGRALP